jgi:hypothetical protein
MPGLMMHFSLGCQCTHLATAVITPGQPRVLVSAQPVATMAGQIAVAGCPFQVPVGAGTKPQPCVTVKWSMPSTRVLILGQPVMLVPGPGPGPGVCLSVEQIPAGPPAISAVQPRVFAL